MKFFNKTAQQIGPVSKNNEKLWLDIVKLFNGNKKFKIDNFTSFSDIINNARHDYYRELYDKLDRAQNKPYLEDNLNDNM